MDENVKQLLEKIKTTPDFCGVAFDSINDTNVLGDNALHCVCVWGDMVAAKLLVENGIEINQQGEGCLTPLNMALDFEHKELAAYLISKGADINVIGAEFKYDPEQHNEHLKRMEAEIHKLEKEIYDECSHT